jgi:uncharacterized protein (TIGR03083 family)
MSDTHRTTLGRDEIWRVIDAQRTALADLLAELSDAEWRQQSLCAAWTVRDVTAHLTQQQLGVLDLIRFMSGWRGSMDRTIEHAARRHAAELTTGEFVAELRGMVGSRRHTVVVTPREVLCDILVHGQDIAIPLGREYPVPAGAAAFAATRVLSMRWPRPLPATKRVAKFRLTATDTDWSAGTGPEVRGPMDALLLVCTGRLVALPRLSGPGAADLRARLSAPART